MIKRNIIAVLFFLTAFTVQLFAVQPDANKRFYITPDGTGDCSSWANACGIDKLYDINNYIWHHENENFEIFMKVGEYHFNSNISFSSNNFILYGGMAGNETEPITTESPHGKSVIINNNTQGYTFKYGNFYNIKIITKGYSAFRDANCFWCIGDTTMGNGGVPFSHDDSSLENIIYRCVSITKTYTGISTIGYIINSIAIIKEPYNNYTQCFSGRSVYNSICFGTKLGGDYIYSSYLFGKADEKLLHAVFVDPDNDDYHLKPNSGAIDKGQEVTRSEIPGLPEDVLVSSEPQPNGGKVNLGIYGGTPMAQITPQSASTNNRFYITPDGTGDCSSWANACGIDNISDIVDYAITLYGNVEIFMKAGEYHITKGIILGRENFPTDKIILYGGMAGNENEPITTDSPHGKSVIIMDNSDPYADGVDFVIKYGKVYNVKVVNSLGSGFQEAYCYWSVSDVTGSYHYAYYKCPLVYRSISKNSYIFYCNNVVNSIIIRDGEYGCIEGGNITTQVYNTICFGATWGFCSRCSRHSSYTFYTPTQENLRKVFVDPDNENYHLKTDSIALDKGQEVTQSEVSGIPENILVSSEPQPNGGKVNLGIYGGTPMATPTLTFDISDITCNKNTVKVAETFNCSARINFFDLADGHTFTYKWIISKDGKDNQTLSTGIISCNGNNSDNISGTNLQFNKNLYIGNSEVYLVVYDNQYPSYTPTKVRTFTVTDPVPIQSTLFVSCTPEVVAYPNENQSICVANINYPYGDLTYEWSINGTTIENNTKQLVVNVSGPGQTKNIMVKVYPVGYNNLAVDNTTTVISGIPPVINSISCTPTSLEAGHSIACSVTAENPNPDGGLTYYWLIDGKATNLFGDNITYTVSSVKDFNIQAKVCVYNKICSVSDNISIYVDSPVPKIIGFNCAPEVVSYPLTKRSNCSLNVNYPYGKLTYKWFVNNSPVYEGDNNSFDVVFTDNGQIKDVKVIVYPTNFPDKIAESDVKRIYSGNYPQIPVSIVFDSGIDINGGITPYHLAFNVHLDKEVYKYFLDKIEVLLAKNDNDTYSKIGTLNDPENLHFETNITSPGNYKLKIKSYSKVISDNNTYETIPIELSVIAPPPDIEGKLKIFKYTPTKIGVMFDGYYIGLKNLIKKNFIRKFKESVIPDTEKFVISYNGITKEIKPDKWYHPWVIYQDDNMSNNNVHVEFSIDTTLGRKIKAESDIDMTYYDTINVTPDFIKNEYYTVFFGSCYGYKSSCYREFKSKRYLSEKITKLSWEVYKINSDNSTEKLKDNISGYYVKVIDGRDGVYKIILKGKTNLNRNIYGERIEEIRWRKNAPVEAAVKVYPVYITKNNRIKIVKSKYVYPLTPYNVYVKITFPEWAKKYLNGWIFEYSTDNNSWTKIGGDYNNFVYGITYKINHTGKNYFRVKTKNKFSGTIYTSKSAVFETIPVPQDINNAPIPIRINARIYSKYAVFGFYNNYKDLEKFRSEHLDVIHNEYMLTKYKNWKIYNNDNNSLIKEGHIVNLVIPIKDIDNLTTSYKITFTLPTTLKRNINAKLILTGDDIRNLIKGNLYKKEIIETKELMSPADINIDNSSIIYLQSPIDPKKVRFILNIDGKIMSYLDKQGYRVEFDCGDNHIEHNLLNFSHIYSNLDNYTVTLRILDKNTNNIIKELTENIILKDKSDYIQSLLDNEIIKIKKEYFNKIYKKLGLVISSTSEIMYYLLPKLRKRIYVNGFYVKSLRNILLPLDYNKNTVKVDLKIYSYDMKTLLAEKEYTIPIENDFYTPENLNKLFKIKEFIKLSDLTESDYLKKYYWGYVKERWGYDFKSVLGYVPNAWYTYVYFLTKKAKMKIEWRLLDNNTGNIVYKTSYKKKIFKIKKEGTYVPALYGSLTLGDNNTIVIEKKGTPLELVNNPGEIVVNELTLSKLPVYKDKLRKYLVITADITYNDPDTLLKNITYYICGQKIGYHLLKMKKIIRVPKELIGNIPDSCNVKIEVVDNAGKTTVKEINVPINSPSD